MRFSCGRGTLVLVVGPSGAGKDSIIGAAAKQFVAESHIVFARRHITRPAEASGEDHVAVSAEEFARLRDSGGFMLYWEAHGQGYGLPCELATALRSGLWVVANASRGVVAEARRRYAPVIVVGVSAPPAILARRLAGRGRESETEIRQRLERAGAVPLEDADLVINNEGGLELAIDLFVAFLRERMR